MADIFISYARGDRERAAQLAAALEGAGYSVWWDRHIVGGAEFSADIERELKAARAVIVAWSKDAISSHWVKDEATAAREAGKLVPISLDGIEPPMGFRQLHTIAFADWTGDIEGALFHAVKAGVAQKINLPAGIEVAAVRVREPPLLQLPSKPSIAVLPFENLSDDREQDYFADGMVEEIITGLSRIKWLFVISRNSTFIYKGKPVDVKTVGRELGVRYVLEGSVRRSGDHVRVTGQLIDAETATQVWADRYDGTLGDIFTLQDEMTMSVIGAVEPTLRKAEVDRARRKRPDSLDAYDLFLRAFPFAATAMPEDAEKALHLLEEAIRLEPDYAVAHGFIAWCHEQRYLRGGLRAETREAARKHAHAAISAGSDDATALAMGGFVIAVIERDYTTALDVLDRALALSPSSALAFGFSSIVRAWTGDLATAIAHAKSGIRLSPYDPLIYLPYVGLAYAHFFAGDWAEAANAARRASQANPRFSAPCFLLTAALIQLDRIDEATLTSKRVLELQPGFTVSGLVAGNITTPERMAILADALRQAGLPQ
jgi:TolB-like protein